MATMTEGFRLNLSAVKKMAQEGMNYDSDEDKNQLSKTTVPIRKPQDSDSSDVDDDLVAIPIGDQNEEEEKKEPNNDVAAPTIQISQLPEVEDSDDEDIKGGEDGQKLGLLFDLLLPKDECQEDNEEWSFKSFIKKFAKTEANDVEDGFLEYEEEEEEEEYDSSCD